MVWSRLHALTGLMAVLCVRDVLRQSDCRGSAASSRLPLDADAFRALSAQARRADYNWAILTGAALPDSDGSASDRAC
jgi:hypothetical protein